MARARRSGGMAKNGRQGPSALGFEATLWQAADKLCNNVDATIEANLKGLGYRL